MMGITIAVNKSTMFSIMVTVLLSLSPMTNGQISDSLGVSSLDSSIDATVLLSETPSMSTSIESSSASIQPSSSSIAVSSSADVFEYGVGFTFPVDDTLVDFNTSSSAYIALVDQVKTQIEDILVRIIENFIRFIITSVSPGSVIVNGTIVVSDVGEHREDVIEAIVIITQTSITIDSQSAAPTILIQGTTYTGSQACAILNALNPCPSGFSCETVNGLAVCVEDDDDDLDIPLIVGLCIGIPWLVIIIILIIVFAMKKSNKSKTRVGSEANVREDGGNYNLVDDSDKHSG